MHPPFYVVDHKVGPRAPHPFDDRPHVRRGLPEPLRLGLPASGAAPLLTEPRAAPAATPPGASSGGGWLARLWRKPDHSPA